MCVDTPFPRRWVRGATPGRRGWGDGGRGQALAQAAWGSFASDAGRPEARSGNETFTGKVRAAGAAARAADVGNGLQSRGRTGRRGRTRSPRVSLHKPHALAEATRAAARPRRRLLTQAVRTAECSTATKKRETPPSAATRTVRGASCCAESVVRGVAGARTTDTRSSAAERDPTQRASRRAPGGGRGGGVGSSRGSWRRHGRKEPRGAPAHGAARTARCRRALSRLVSRLASTPCA